LLERNLVGHAFDLRNVATIPNEARHLVFDEVKSFCCALAGDADDDRCSCVQSIDFLR
jgi:hypothetical protein